MCSLNFHSSLWIPKSFLRLLEVGYTSRFSLLWSLITKKRSRINHFELNHNVLYDLPFFTLDSQKFLKISGGWLHQSFQSVTESDH